MLAYASEEGQEMGLNLIEGYVRKFDDKTLLCPYGLEFSSSVLGQFNFEDFDKYREFYFLHFLFL